MVSTLYIAKNAAPSSIQRALPSGKHFCAVQTSSEVNKVVNREAIDTSVTNKLAKHSESCN
jgi:hypothetical protein